MEPKFFKTAKQLREWFKKNHNKKNELWIGVYKKGIAQSVTNKEAVHEAICFGWVFTLMKSIDEYSYKMRCVPRKKNSVWGYSAVNYAKKLIKSGEMAKPGKIAFESRNKKRSGQKPTTLTAKQIKIFKANEKAWEFFSKQTPSYQKYMQWWVSSAKRQETQEKRLQMLIEDSANESKLRTIVKATEKYQNKIKTCKHDLI